MSNFFTRFQARNQRNVISNRTVNTSFITSGENSTVLSNKKTYENIQAAVVCKPEQDVCYIYTLKNNPMKIGSIWKTNKNAMEEKLGEFGDNYDNDITLLVSQQITVIKNTGWNKYVAFPCNLEVNGLWGYFIGPEKKNIAVELNKEVLVQSKQYPVLIMPEGSLNYGDKIMIKKRAWLVHESDEISTSGIGYYSLRPTTMSKEVIDANKNKDIFIERATDFSYPTETESPSNNNSGYVSANKEITVKTENGFFKTNKTVNIVRHTTSEVVFKIPYGTNSLEVQVKVNGTITTINYEVQ